MIKGADGLRFCPVLSGSSGNLLYIEGNDTRILIDCGLAGNYAAQALEQFGFSMKNVDAILVTHDHSDHTKGVGILSRRHHIPIYANPATYKSMAPIVGVIYPGYAHTFETGKEFQIKGLSITSFSIPHDAADPVGFVISNGAKRVGILTDIGRFNDWLLSFVAGCDMVLIEANHDIDMLNAGPYPYALKRRILSERGHLSNDACGKALVKLYGAGVRSAVLGHMSKENNLEALALETVRQTMRQAGIADADFFLDAVPRGGIGRIYDI